MALDWGITLKCDTAGKEDSNSVGVRSHFIHPVSADKKDSMSNVFSCKIKRII